MVQLPQNVIRAGKKPPKSYIVESAGGPIVSQTIHIPGAVPLKLSIFVYFVRVSSARAEGTAGQACLIAATRTECRSIK